MDSLKMDSSIVMRTTSVPATDNGRFGISGVDGTSLFVSENAVVSENGWGGVHARLGSTVGIFGNVRG